MRLWPLPMPRFDDATIANGIAAADLQTFSEAADGMVRDAVLEAR